MSSTAVPLVNLKSPLPPLTDGPHRKRLGFISIVACLGGLLFGYDTGVANGAEGPMAHELGLSLFQLGVVISSLVFAAAVGALVCGPISDAFGRRKMIIILSVLFFVGTFFVVFSPHADIGEFSPIGFATLVTGRIMLGLAVGGASTIVPVYLAELSPYEIRGSITGRNELAIVSGQLAAFVINALILSLFHGVIDGIWRIMFAVCAIPAAALFIGMLRMPESPRWLVSKGKHEEAMAVLMTVRSPDRAEAEMLEVERIAAEEDTSSRSLGIKAIFSNKWLFRIVLVGIGVAVAQQFTGINSIMYYGTRVLEESGMTADQAIYANISFGVVAVIGGVIALRNMDRLNRRTTFIIGLSLTTLCHILIAIAGTVFAPGNPLRPLVILVLVTAFVMSMQTFLNIAVWVYLAEIFPLHMRGLGIGISVFFGWGANGLLSLTFPSLVSGVGITTSFLIFAVLGVFALIFVATQVPETRGRSLESLERDIYSGAAFDKGKNREMETVE